MINDDDNDITLTDGCRESRVTIEVDQPLPEPGAESVDTVLLGQLNPDEHGSDAWILDVPGWWLGH